MLIVQLSDPHVTVPGGLLDQMARTTEQLARAIAQVNALVPQPTLVLLTGDLVDGGRREEYVRLRGVLDPLRAPLYLLPGNHDDRAALCDVFDHHAYLPRDGGFLQYTIEEHPVRVIALDTLVPRADVGLLCAERLAWLDARLAEAPTRPTVVALHHPPFVTGIELMDEMGLEGRDALAAVVARHPQVERVVCGHIHRAITRRFAGTVVTVCPGVAHQVGLDLPPRRRLRVTPEPPGMLLHAWLGTEGGLVTHLLPIGEGLEGVVVHDGTDWVGTKPAVEAGG